jgi:hypothetical protein
MGADRQALLLPAKLEFFNSIASVKTVLSTDRVIEVAG